MYVCMEGWMDGCIRMDASGWMDGCMHVCMYVWSRVPCSRGHGLGGPYHLGGVGPGIRSPDSYIHNQLILVTYHIHSGELVHHPSTTSGDRPDAAWAAGAAG